MESARLNHGGVEIMQTRRSFIACGAGLLGCAANPNDAGQIVRAVVAADGRGDFSTIQRAVDHILDRPPASVARAILEIRPGVYRERVKIPRIGQT